MTCARRLWPLLSRCMPLPRRELFAAVSGCVLALLYALLSGFSVPAQRTVVMLTAFLLARESARCCTPAWSVAVALIAVLLLDPLAPLSAGFWLSFLAVIAIVMIAGARVAPGAPLRDAVRVQWLVSTALLPVTVAIFGTFSAIGLLANALAIPAFTFALVPPVLIATASYLIPWHGAGWLGDLLVDITAWVAACLWPFLTWCAGLPAALWRSDAPLSWFVLAGPAALLAVLPVRRSWRTLGLVLLASVFAMKQPRPGEGQLWIDVPDAGRSAAVMLRTRDHLLLLGSGESFGSGGRAFDAQLAPLLRASGYEAIDLWLPGTLSRDTQAAVTHAAALMPLRRVLVPPARGVPPEMQACEPSAWQWNDIGFEMWPAANGRSCELMARSAAGEVRFGGSEATSLPAAEGELLQLTLGPAGLQQRRRYLGL